MHQCYSSTSTSGVTVLWLNLSMPFLSTSRHCSSPSYSARKRSFFTPFSHSTLKSGSFELPFLDQHVSDHFLPSHVLWLLYHLIRATLKIKGLPAFIFTNDVTYPRWDFLSRRETSMESPEFDKCLKQVFPSKWYRTSPYLRTWFEFEIDRPLPKYTHTHTHNVNNIKRKIDCPIWIALCISNVISM